MYRLATYGVVMYSVAIYRLQAAGTENGTARQIAGGLWPWGKRRLLENLDDDECGTEH